MSQHSFSSLIKNLDIIQWLEEITRLRAELAELENEAALLISRGQRVKAQEMFDPKHDQLNKKLSAAVKNVAINGFKN